MGVVLDTTITGVQGRGVSTEMDALTPYTFFARHFSRGVI